jgi:hypothetical protein
VDPDALIVARRREPQVHDRQMREALDRKVEGAIEFGAVAG